MPTRIGELEIPEDLVIAVDVLSLHYDPKYWGKVDPNKFYPERLTFSTSKKQTKQN